MEHFVEFSSLQRHRVVGFCEGERRVIVPGELSSYSGLLSGGGRGQTPFSVWFVLCFSCFSSGSGSIISCFVSTFGCGIPVQVAGWKTQSMAVTELFLCCLTPVFQFV